MVNCGGFRYLKSSLNINKNRKRQREIQSSKAQKLREGKIARRGLVNYLRKDMCESRNERCEQEAE